MSSEILFQSGMIKTSQVDPGLYEDLGLEVVKTALAGNTSLSDAAVDVLQEYPDFNAIQVGNVCWAANNECFRKLAEQREATGAPDLVFDFDLAQPPDVLKRLDKMAAPKEKELDDDDYLLPPEDHATPEDDELLKQAFATTHPVKINPNLSAINPYAPLTELREKLAAAESQIVSAVGSLAMSQDSLEAEFYKHIKTAVLQSVPLVQVAHFLAHHPDGENGAAHELSKVANAMCANDPEAFHFLKESSELNSSFRGTPDYDHPIYQTYSSLRQTRKDLVKYAAARKIASRDLRYVTEVEQRSTMHMAKVSTEWKNMREQV